MKEHLKDEQAVVDERTKSENRDVLELLQPIELAELQPIVSVSPSSTISSVVETMLSNRVGCVVVVDQKKLVGLFTERDLLCKVAPTGIDIEETPVSFVMTRQPETLPIDSPLVYALQRMTVGGYRHVPLVDGDGKAVAVISMRDIVQHIVSFYPDQILNIPDQPISWSGRDGA